MAPDRVIPDSDDDSDVLLLSPEKKPADTPSLPETDLNDSTSQPEEQSAPQDYNTSSTTTGSTAQLMRALHSAQKALAGPTPTPQYQYLAAPGHELNSSRSPTVLKVNRRQTTIGIVESQREEVVVKPERRKTLKTYGSYSKGSQGPSSWLEEEFNSGRLDFAGHPRKRLRMESQAPEEGDEPTFNNTEGGKFPTELEDFFTYSSKPGPELNHVSFASSEYTTSEEQRKTRPGFDSNSIEDTFLIGEISNQAAGQEEESQGLRSTSKDPALEILPSSLEFAGPASNLAVDLRSTVALTASQKQQYEYLGESVPITTENPTPSPNGLLQELWGNNPDDSSTFPIVSNERYDSNLVEIQKAMEDSSDPQLNDIIIQSRKLTPGRSKSMLIDKSTSNIAQSSSPVRPQPSRRNKTSVAREDAGTPILSIDSLALPPSVKEKTEKKPTKRGRKPKAQVDESLDGLASDETIGLPKEQHKPRPSRSRSNTHDDPVVEEPKTSPEKSSGLDSEEIAVSGLPKEQYKPRPSRSRGGRSAAEVFESPDFVKPKKYKRGITTGHILKKKFVDSDDEDEVIYVEERPRKEKDKRAPLELVKTEMHDKRQTQEANEAALEDLAETAGDEESGRNRQTAEDDTVITSAPAALLPQTQTSGFKKRGRKPKQITEFTTDSVDAQHVSEIPPSQELPTIVEEIATPEPKKRGRKRKKTMESASEADKTDANEIFAIQEEASEPIPPEAPEPKKRGRKRKKTADLVEVESKVADTEDTSTSHPQTERPLMEKDPNTKAGSRSTGRGTTSRLSMESSQNQDENYEGEAIPATYVNQTQSDIPTVSNPPETPHKGTTIEAEHEKTESTTKQDPKAKDKGPAKHSPINASKVKFRVGLSKKARIAPLLKIARK